MSNPTRQPWILCDFSWMAHRARFALKNLAWEEKPIGMIYGICEQLRTLCMDPRIRSSQLAMLLDSRKSIRRLHYPAYKARRHKLSADELADLEVMREQMRILVKDVFPRIGFETYRQTGLESDDLMASAAKTCAPGRAVLVTADKDLLQAVSSRAAWHDPCRGVWVTSKSFEADKGIDPPWWGEVKAIAGCQSDGVPGVRGVGERTAIRFLIGNLPEHHKTYQLIQSKAGQAVIERNRELVVLPHAKTRPVELRVPHYNPDAFFKFCEDYGFQTYLEGKRHEQWERILEGGLEAPRTIRTRRRNKRPGRPTSEDQHSFRGAIEHAAGPGILPEEKETEE